MKKLSNYIITILILLFAIGLIVFSSSNVIIINNSFELFINTVFPSLFPFLIVVELLSYTFLIPFITSKFGIVMERIFNLPKIASYPFIMGLFSGYPVGAKIVTNLRLENKISKYDGNRLLIFTNNPGPMFVIGSVGIGFFCNKSIGFLLLLVQFISCLITTFCVGHFFNAKKRNDSIDYSKELSIESFGEIISTSIKNAFYTLSIVCGFILLFSLIISMLQESKIISIFFFNNKFLEYIFLGMLETTSGIKLITSLTYISIKIKLIITAFFLSFGGISVLLQVWSIISKTDLSIKPYIIGKIFNGLISSAIILLLL